MTLVLAQGMTALAGLGWPVAVVEREHESLRGSEERAELFRIGREAAERMRTCAYLTAPVVASLDETMAAPIRATRFVRVAYVRAGTLPPPELDEDDLPI